MGRRNKQEKRGNIMSKFSRFMRENKVVKENQKYAPTKSLKDEKGNPLEWEFRHITSKENETLRDASTFDVPVTGRPNNYRQKINISQYVSKMIVTSTVFPDLYDAGLQDSYGVKTPEDLLFAMVDDPGEYNDFSVWIQRFQGFDSNLDEKAEEAKN